MRLWEPLSCLNLSLVCCWISAAVCALDKFMERLLQDRYVLGSGDAAGSEKGKPSPAELSLWSFQSPGTERKSSMGASDGSHLLGGGESKRAGRPDRRSTKPPDQSPSWEDSEPQRWEEAGSRLGLSACWSPFNLPFPALHRLHSGCWGP